MALETGPPFSRIVKKKIVGKKEAVAGYIRPTKLAGYIRPATLKCEWSKWLRIWRRILRGALLFWVFDMSGANRSSSTMGATFYLGREFRVGSMRVYF